MAPPQGSQGFSPKKPLHDILRRYNDERNAGRLAVHLAQFYYFGTTAMRHSTAGTLDSAKMLLIKEAIVSKFAMRRCREDREALWERCKKAIGQKCNHLRYGKWLSALELHLYPSVCCLHLACLFNPCCVFVLYCTNVLTLLCFCIYWLLLTPYRYFVLRMLQARLSPKYMCTGTRSLLSNTITDTNIMHHPILCRKGYHDCACILDSIA